MNARLFSDWITFALIVGCYILWFCAGALWLTSFWVLGLVVLPVLAAFHGSLQHETIHGHPTRWEWVNEALVSLPLLGVFPYRRYKSLHIQHHRDEHLTDPYEDPESYFWPEDAVREMNDFQRHIFALNNTFVGRLVIGPTLTLVGFTRTELTRIKANETGVRLAWGLHVIGLIALYVIIAALFQMPIWIYFTCVIYPGLSLTAMRSYAEHQAAENVGARTAIVETCPALALLYLNNNLHIVHHASPATPWYDLPVIYKERRKNYLAANENTLFNGYSDIARRFAWQVKQPVAHPIPRVQAAHNLNGRRSR